MKTLTTALIKVQSELEAIPKTRTNPFFKSKYADLESIWNAVKPILKKNGFAVSQTTGNSGDKFGLITKLLHESGESIEGFYNLLPSKPNDPQALGAALTYARRYALSAILGLVVDEDDDGNAASQVAHNTPPNRATIPQEPQKQAESSKRLPDGSYATISAKQAVRLYAIAKASGWTSDTLKSALVAEFGYNDTKEVKPEDYDVVCEYFGKKQDIIEENSF